MACGCDRFAYALAYPASTSAGLTLWQNVSSPGIELVSLIDAGGGTTQATWAVTYLPAAGPTYTGDPTTQLSGLIAHLAEASYTLVLPNAATITCHSNRIFCNAYLRINELACPSINVTLWGAAAPVVTPYPSSTSVCVTNCGVLPWHLVVTYAAATGNWTALSAPRQVQRTL